MCYNKLIDKYQGVYNWVKTWIKNLIKKYKDLSQNECIHAKRRLHERKNS